MKSNISMKTAICAVISITCLGPALARGSAEKHAKDFFEVIDGYCDNDLKKIYETFSSNIDDNKNAEVSSCVSARIKRKIAQTHGMSVRDVHLTAHRYIAHNWPFAGKIPEIDILENKFPGCRKDVQEIWSEFCRESSDTIAREFGWQSAPRLAQSYCAILYYTHLLADRLPPPENDPDQYKYIMGVDKIVRELQLTIERMGSSERHKKYCDEFRQKMSAALAAGKSPQDQAVHVLAALKSMKIGTMLHEYYGKNGQMDESRHQYREEPEQSELKKAA